MNKEILEYKEYKEAIQNVLLKYNRIAVIGASNIQSLRLMLDFDVTVKKIPVEDEYERSFIYSLEAMLTVNNDYQMCNQPVYLVQLIDKQL